MISPDLANVYGMGPPDGKFMKLSSAFTSGEANNVSVLGIIVSSTLPKNCGSRASHKFCCSFFIIDPFYATPTAPVCVNLFMNNSKNFLPAYTIGDVIFCQNMRLQKYRDFPQLVGNFEKSTIFIFRNKKHAVVDNDNDEQSNERTTQVLQSDDYEIHNYTATRATLADIDAPLSRAIIQLSNWAHDFFKSQTMADASTFPHYNIHSLLHHYNIFQHQNERYQAIFPPNMQVTPSPTLTGSVGPEMAKLDVIGLVLSNTKGTGNIPTRILLWDGTGNGYYPSIPGAARHITMIDRAMQSAADAAEIWQQFVQRGKVLGFTNGNFSNANDNNNSSSNSLSGKEGSTMPWDQDLFLGSFFVVESHDLPDQTLHQEFLTNFQPGKWIRLRNVTITNQRTDFGVPVGEVRSDAHVSFLQPYFRDVRTLISDYFVRIHRHLLILEHQRKQQQLQIQQQQQQQQKQQQQVTSTSTRSSSSTSTTSASRQRQVNEKGHSQTLFAWIMALPAPPANKMMVEFFCAGCVVNWYPHDTSKFVQSTVKEDGNINYRFLFSLRIFDCSQSVQVIFSDKEATKLLGISPEEYATNENYAHILEEKLTQMKESQATMQTNIRLYTKLLSIPISKPSRGSTPHSKKRLVKRIMAFDAVAPLQLSLPSTNKSTASCQS